MEAIDIVEFANYNAELVEEFLRQLKGPRIQIKIDTDLPDEDESVHYFRFRTYAEGAYAADLLFFASKSFGYYTPCVALFDSFFFLIDLRDIPPVAKELAYIAAAYGDTEGDIREAYFEKAKQYYHDVFDGKINSYVWGLLYKAREELKKFNEESGY